MMGLPIKSELAREEAIIERGLKSFIEVGNALMRIRDNDLYTITHDTFEAYCKERWGMSRPRAYQLIEAAATNERLSTVVNKPTSERQIRPLTALPPNRQAEVWKEAVETAPKGRVTSEHVANVVRMRKGVIATKKKLPRFSMDNTGLKIGSQAMHYAETSILHLKQISTDDPEITKALRHVINFCKSRIKEVCVEQKGI